MKTAEYPVTLIDELLAEQAKLGTAVLRFSDWHERHENAPDQARYYKDLVPLSKPQKGEQYAFEVNLDQCTGCKACVVACHSLNGLDDNESWRDVGVLFGDQYISYQQTVTTACHHCADPACANGCPVLAYEKDPDTGIVRHLDDQCIGCSYCILKCPYDVPKFNKKRGIVRKCDMCHQRLAVGEAPACVQSCPNEAIAIRIVKAEELKSDTPFGAARLLPGVMNSSYTKPSTRYVSSKPVPENVLHADAERPRVEESHTPLAVMLVLTQLATGALLFANTPTQKWIGFVTAALGVMASTAHLGQPLKAFRCFLGWRKSWLSREIIAFGGFAPAAFGAALGLLPVWMAAAVGLMSVFCSVMVYVDTKRPFWAFSQTAPKFFGTSIVLGLSLTACFDETFRTAAVVACLCKLLFEAPILSLSRESLSRTQYLLSRPLESLHLARFTFGLIGMALTQPFPIVGFSLILIGEFLERALFFRAGAAWKMPGNS